MRPLCGCSRLGRLRLSAFGLRRSVTCILNLPLNPLDELAVKVVGHVAGQRNRLVRRPHAIQLLLARPANENIEPRFADRQEYEQRDRAVDQAANELDPAGSGIDGRLEARGHADLAGLPLRSPAAVPTGLVSSHLPVDLVEDAVDSLVAGADLGPVSQPADRVRERIDRRRRRLAPLDQPPQFPATLIDDGCHILRRGRLDAARFDRL